MKHILTISFVLTWLIIDGISRSVVGGPQQDSPVFPRQNCTEPITWRVGNIDSRYNLDDDILRDIMNEVKALWSDGVGQNLIEYSDSGEVAINLIYSEEQKFTENEQQLSERINGMRKEYFSMKMEYQRESVEFQRQMNQYNQNFSDYADKVNEYNLTLSRLTNNGIVQRHEDEKLKNLKKEMEFLEKKLEPLEEELNAEESKLQALSEELNDFADEINEYIYQYRDKFSVWKTFHQGYYINVGNQKKINIYQYANLDKLKLVLAHEVGHALGLSHVDNPVSVMHHRMQLQNEKSLKLTEEDIQALHNRCQS